VKFDALIFAVASVMTYCMSSSARRSNAWGSVNPSALGVFRSITSSNLVGCKTGGSAGFAPLRMRRERPVRCTAKFDLASALQQALDCQSQAFDRDPNYFLML